MILKPVHSSQKRIPMSRIRALANQIGQTFNPDKVVLFHSYAYGKLKPESDVHLLVVRKSDKRNVEHPLAIALTLEYHYWIELDRPYAASIERTRGTERHLLKRHRLEGKDSV